MKTRQDSVVLFAIIILMTMFSSGCTVVIDKNSGLASTQYRGQEIFRSGYTHRSGVRVINPYPDQMMKVTIEVTVRQYVRTRYGRDRYGYMVYTTPCPPNRVIASHTHTSSSYGENVFAASPTIVLSENEVVVSVTFIDRNGNHTAGESRIFRPGNSRYGWGYEMVARKVN